MISLLRGLEFSFQNSKSVDNLNIIMAGKVGSFITSSIGTMRVTEQIDALEVMGINAINYLVFPKFIAL